MQLSHYPHAPRAMRLFPSRSLQRLVVRHADACTRLGLNVAAITGEDDPAVRRWLGERAERLPSALADDLERIDELTDERGANELVTVAAARGLDPGTLGRDPLEAAVSAFLDHPDAFHVAQARRTVAKLRGTSEFTGRELQPRSDFGGAQLRAMEADLGGQFEGRSRSAHCRVTAVRDESLTVFTVAHGSLVRVDETLEAEPSSPAAGPVYLREGTVRYRPQRRDVVVYDERRGCLRVRAADAPTVGAYRRAFGTLLHGDAGWFGDGPVVCLEPLVREGERVEVPTHGLRAVRLVGLILRHSTGPHGTLALDSEDIWPYLRVRLVDSLENADLVEATFHVTPAGTDRRIPVRVRMPNHVHYGHVPDQLFRPYLEERGFLASAPAAPAP